jgi:hypothetical protein
MIRRRKTSPKVSTSFSPYQKVYILSRRKKSQTWRKYGIIKVIENNKALIIWDYIFRRSAGSWVELTQLKHERRTTKRTTFYS